MAQARFVKAWGGIRIDMQLQFNTVESAQVLFQNVYLIHIFILPCTNLTFHAGHYLKHPLEPISVCVQACMCTTALFFYF